MGLLFGGMHRCVFISRGGYVHYVSASPTAAAQWENNALPLGALGNGRALQLLPQEQTFFLVSSIFLGKAN